MHNGQAISSAAILLLLAPIGNLPAEEEKFGVPVGKPGTVRIKGEDGQPIVLKRTVTLSRWTFVLDREGKIVYKNINVSPALDAKKVTELIDNLEKK